MLEDQRVGHDLGHAQALTKGKVSPMRSVPEHIVCPPYALTGATEADDMEQRPLSDEEIEKLRAACKAACRVLNLTLQAVAPGVTTDELDRIVHEGCIAEGGYPSPRNYRGFPKSVCTSVNEVICHGIPDDRPLREGDIVNVDVTIFLNGFHGDCSQTVPVGEIDPASRKLLQVARECLDLGIAAIKPGAWISDIGRAVEAHAEAARCSVVRSYCGHGVGRQFHSKPTVPHYYDPDDDVLIRPRTAFTVEPMINMGTWKHKLWPDQWTAVTKDGKRSAQFEHTVLMMDNGPEILTVV